MKTHTGGCHCGKVRYAVDVDLSEVMDCNCSHCSKKGFLLAFVPAENFHLKTPEGDVSEYRFNRKLIQHKFCPSCGVQSYGRGKRPDGTDTVAINVRCLDDVDTDALPRKKIDGKSF